MSRPRWCASRMASTSFNEWPVTAAICGTPDQRFFNLNHIKRPRPIIEGRQRAMGQRPLDATLDSLVMDPKSAPHGTERRIFSVGQRHLRPRDAACRLASRPRKSRQCFNPIVGHCQLDRLPPSRHGPLLIAPIANEESANSPSVPTQISWNRSSRYTSGGFGTCGFAEACSRQLAQPAGWSDIDRFK
jgi:hypothetical protein